MGNQKGFIKFKTAVWLLVIAGTIYVAAKLGPPYVQNYRLQKLVNQIATNYGNPERRPSIMVYIQKQIRYMNIPFEWRDFVIEREGQRVWVTLQWDHTVVWIPPNPLVPAQYQTLEFYNEGVADYRD